MRRRFIFAAIVLCAASGHLPARGQEPGPLPKAETVLDQYIEATGGKAAYEKVKNRMMLTALEITGAPKPITIRIFAAAPNSFALVMEDTPVGKIVKATDGKSAWEISPVTGDRLMEGAEKEEFIRSATFNDDLHVKELYDKVECVGVEDVDGKPAYKLVLTAKSGKTETKFYDKASHLMVKETSTTKGPMGEFTVEGVPSDYKTYDGILYPFTVTEKGAGQQMVAKISEIKHNVEIPADTFKRPASLDGAEKKKAD